jgi:hypothetical protein|tara:strand:+ start:4400 stop:4636 length:237 start_codon:yes stop_codon:yes gene_type:complete
VSKCPGCKSLNRTLNRERTFTSWIVMALLNRTEDREIKIEGKELKALRPAEEEPVITQDSKRGTIELKMRSKPKLVGL